MILHPWHVPLVGEDKGKNNLEEAGMEAWGLLESPNSSGMFPCFPPAQSTSASAGMADVIRTPAVVSRDHTTLLWSSGNGHWAWMLLTLQPWCFDLESVLSKGRSGNVHISSCSASWLL